MIGDVGVLRPGQAAAAKRALGALVRATADDSAVGEIIFFEPPSSSVHLGIYFSKTGQVRAQSAIPALHSCDMTLSDQPAGRSLVTAALRAATAHHLGQSVSRLRSSVQQVLASDNPVRHGSVIFTLLERGAARQPLYQGAPRTYRLKAITVVMNYPDGAVTSVARGGL